MFKNLANCSSSLVFWNLWGKGKDGVYKGGLSRKVILRGTTSSDFYLFPLLFNSTPSLSFSTSIFSSNSKIFYSTSFSSFFLPFWAHIALSHFLASQPYIASGFSLYHSTRILGDFLSKIVPIIPSEFLDFSEMPPN